MKKYFICKSCDRRCKLPSDYSKLCPDLEKRIKNNPGNFTKAKELKIPNKPTKGVWWNK
jgi:hypothetical protein